MQCYKVYFCDKTYAREKQIHKNKLAPSQYSETKTWHKVDFTVYMITSEPMDHRDPNK